MPTKPRPKKSKAALLLIDLINHFDFEDGERLHAATMEIVDNVSRLKKAAAAADVPVIYVNDNFGNWRDDFKQTVTDAMKSKLGSSVVRKLKPGADDYFALKPMHSGFYYTSLEPMLHELGTGTLILTGITTDICVQVTANDAYMRHYKVVIAEDAVAAVTPERSRTSLEYLARVAHAEILPAEKIVGKYFT